MGLVSRPHVVPPSADTPEARLAALEEQRSYDHRVIYDLANALAALQGQFVQQSSGLQALTESGLSLRQESSQHARISRPSRPAPTTLPNVPPWRKWR